MGGPLPRPFPSNEWDTEGPHQVTRSYYWHSHPKPGERSVRSPHSLFAMQTEGAPSAPECDARGPPELGGD